MSQESAAPEPNEPTPPAPPAAPSRSPPSRRRRRRPSRARGSRVGAIIVLVLIVVSLAWYFVSDRLTPHTSQARVQAFVVPVAAEVAGQVLKVHVKNNDEVQPGQPLFDIDSEPYRIALQRSRSDYESVRRSVNASGVDGGGGQGGTAGGERPAASTPQQDAKRLEQIYAEDPGAISLRRVQNAQASRDHGAQPGEGRRGRSAQRAREGAGERGENNAQLISARSAVEKAELDLKRTKVVAPVARRRSPTCAPTSASSRSPARRR